MSTKSAKAARANELEVAVGVNRVKDGAGNEVQLRDLAPDLD